TALPSNDAARAVENLDAGAVEMSVLGEVAAEGPGAGPAVEKPEDVTRHGVEPNAAPKLILDVRPEGIEHIEARRDFPLRTEDLAVDPGEKIGIGIGGAAEHHAVHMVKLGFRRGE